MINSNFFSMNPEFLMLLITVSLLFYVFSMCLIGILVLETWRTMKKKNKENHKELVNSINEVNNIKQDLSSLTKLIIETNNYTFLDKENKKEILEILLQHNDIIKETDNEENEKQNLKKSEVIS